MGRILYYPRVLYTYIILGYNPKIKYISQTKEGSIIFSTFIHKQFPNTIITANVNARSQLCTRPSKP